MGKIRIEPNDHAGIEIKKFNYLEELESLLMEFGYIKVNGNYKYQGAIASTS